MYTFKTRDMLDLDFENEENWNSESSNDTVSIMEVHENVSDSDTDYCEDQLINSVEKHKFSIDQMRNVLNFYD